MRVYTTVGDYIKLTPQSGYIAAGETATIGVEVNNCSGPLGTTKQFNFYDDPNALSWGPIDVTVTTTLQ